MCVDGAAGNFVFGETILDQQRSQVHGLASQVRITGLQARGRQQVLDQRVELGDVGLGLFQVLGPRLPGEARY